MEKHPDSLWKCVGLFSSVPGKFWHALCHPLLPKAGQRRTPPDLGSVHTRGASRGQARTVEPEAGNFVLGQCEKPGSQHQDFLDPSLNGTGCHRKQDPSGDSPLKYGRQFVPVLDRRGARRGLALFFLCTLLAYLCYLPGVVTVSVPGRCLSILPAEVTWWQRKALR